jgi:hypothetical protein
MNTEVKEQAACSNCSYKNQGTSFQQINIILYHHRVKQQAIIVVKKHMHDSIYAKNKWPQHPKNNIIFHKIANHQASTLDFTSLVLILLVHLKKLSATSQSDFLLEAHCI